MFFQTFYPNLQTFLQGLIPKIPDILQLCLKTHILIHSGEKNAEVGPVHLFYNSVQSSEETQALARKNNYQLQKVVLVTI